MSEEREVVPHVFPQSVAPADAGSAGGRSEPSAPVLPSQVLDRAADLIEPEGAWTTGDYGFRGGPCCVVGAIYRAGNGPGVYDYLQRAAGVPAGSPMSSWNDEPGRTQAEVVTALREAAELARSEGL